MEEWSGVIGFVVALIFSILIWRIILRSKPQSRNSDDLIYQEQIIRAIRPRCSDISIDEVVEVLKGKDLGTFGLSGFKVNSFDD